MCVGGGGATEIHASSDELEFKAESALRLGKTLLCLLTCLEDRNSIPRAICRQKFKTFSGRMRSSLSGILVYALWGVCRWLCSSCCCCCRLFAVLPYPSSLAKLFSFFSCVFMHRFETPRRDRSMASKLPLDANSRMSIGDARQNQAENAKNIPALIIPTESEIYYLCIKVLQHMSCIS